MTDDIFCIKEMQYQDKMYQDFKDFMRIILSNIHCHIFIIRKQGSKAEFKCFKDQVALTISTSQLVVGEHGLWGHESEVIRTFFLHFEPFLMCTLVFELGAFELCR